MSKFNGTNRSTPDSRNVAGGVAYTRTDKKELLSLILNSMLNGDKYYETDTSRMKRLNDMAAKEAKVDPEFLGKAMIFTRTSGKLRSVSHIMGVNLVENAKANPAVRQALRKSFVRLDDMTEVASLWFDRHKNVMLPNSLRRAIKDTLESADEYLLKKYAADSKSVKMKDLIKLARPNPSKAKKLHEDSFKKCIEDSLDNIDTAETVNSSLTGKARVDTYVRMIKENKLGYMAAIKQIRTLLENGISVEDLKVWCNFITDKKAIERAMILPFRYVDAWNAVKSTDGVSADKMTMVKKSLERAFATSSVNCPLATEEEKVALLIDESGSMGGSEKSPFWLAKIMASAIKNGLTNPDNAYVYTWADECTYRPISGSPFDFIDTLRTSGGGTDVSAPLKKLISTKTFVDKIVIFTDMQMYSNGFDKEIKTFLNTYRSTVNPNAKVLFWNLAGYSGGAPIDLEKTPNVMEVSGYSDKMLEVIPNLWMDKDFILKAINAIKLD